MAASSGIQPRQVAQQQIISGGGFYARLTGRVQSGVYENSQDDVRGFFEWEEVVWEALSASDRADHFWKARVAPAGEKPRNSALFGAAMEITRRQAIPLSWWNIVFITQGSGVIDETRQPLLTFSSPVKWIWAKVTGSTPLHDPNQNQYEYHWTEFVRTGHGEGSTPWTEPALNTDLDWVPLTSSADEYAHNSVEASNTNSSVEGHGVNVSGGGYPAGFGVQAVSAGTPIVRLYEDITFGASGLERYYTVQFENADDGTCA